MRRIRDVRRVLRPRETRETGATDDAAGLLGSRTGSGVPGDGIARPGEVCQ